MTNRPMQRPRHPYARRTTTAGIAGLGCVGLLVAIIAVYAISVLWWSMWLYFGVHWSHAETWSYGWILTHWGLLTPIATGFLFRARGAA